MFENHRTSRENIENLEKSSKISKISKKFENLDSQKIHISSFHISTISYLKLSDFQILLAKISILGEIIYIK